MAAPSLQTLQQLASDTGYQPGTLEKVLRLLDLLQEIASEDLLADRFALKGGTALNMFHLALDRLSVDIDLNYIGELDRKKMLAERPALEAALGRILAAQGYRVRRQPDEHAGGKWLAVHPSACGSACKKDPAYCLRKNCYPEDRHNHAVKGNELATLLAVTDRKAGVARLEGRHRRGRRLVHATQGLRVGKIAWLWP
ncbi:MAG: nucleotidyl transferase AbiEii/AbiGii toxin family protein [Alphaproteobacteria bacterium]|nr:nucleotidyl transferase AbiEii/AbiGii toxin family protein [Alphaproteobacteria bacterium]